MMIFNIQAFGLLDRVFNKDTGLVASLGIDENGHSDRAGEPLPCERPPKGWRRKCLVNIAKAGMFSSDRTIAEYDRDIWHLGK